MPGLGRGCPLELCSQGQGPRRLLGLANAVLKAESSDQKGPFHPSSTSYEGDDDGYNRHEERKWGSATMPAFLRNVHQ